MKIKHTCKLTALALLTLSTISSQLSTAYAQTPAGTVFTYDGKLQYGGSPVADGLYDFQFNLSNAPTGGTQVGSTVSRTAVPVTNGLFTTTLDFGAVFSGNATWLAISVCSNGVGNFQSLAPLQELTPAPYAIYAESSSNVSGTVSAAQLTSMGNSDGGFNNFYVGSAGSPTSSGSANTAVGSSALPGITSGSGNTAYGAGALNGNGSYNTAVGDGALDYLSFTAEQGGSNNIALGYMAGANFTGNESSNIDIGNLGVVNENNTIRIGSGQSQAFIAGVINGNGGGLTNLNASQLTSVGNGNSFGISVSQGNFFIGPAGNSATRGSQNTAIGDGALINVTGPDGFGFANSAFGFGALQANTFANFNTAVGSGALHANTGGDNNTASGFNALFTSTSGSDNTANGFDSLAGDGSYNTAVGSQTLKFLGTFGEAGGSNNIALGYMAGDNFNDNESFNIDIGAKGNTGENYTIRIGDVQTIAYIAGIYGATPRQDTATAVYVDASGQLGTVGPGGAGSGIVSVQGNSDITATTMSGAVTLGDTATSANTPNTIVKRDGGGNFSAGAINLTAGLGLPAIIYNGPDVIASGTSFPTVPLLFDDYSGNFCAGQSAGKGILSLDYSSPAAAANTAVGAGALFTGTSGTGNCAFGFEALSNNVAPLGRNTAVGYQALSANTVGINNIALGYLAGASVNGSGNIDIGNFGVANENNIIRIGTTQTATYLPGNLNVALNVIANGVTLTSDRNAKENISAVNARAVLAKVTSLPVSKWNYKTDNKDVQHIGPMAQDFRAAFGLDGADDKHISVVDEGGVALAAIKGLNEKLESEANEKDVQIQNLKQQNDSLARRLNELEAAVKQLVAVK